MSNSDELGKCLGPVPQRSQARSGGSHKTKDAYAQSVGPSADSEYAIETAQRFRIDIDDDSILSSESTDELQCKQSRSAEVEEDPGQLPWKMQHGLTINMPTLNGANKNEYTFLPGHYTVHKILRGLLHDKYLVSLESGEVDVLTKNELRADFNQARTALQEFEQAKSRLRVRHAVQIPLLPSGILDMGGFDHSHSITDSVSDIDHPRKRTKLRYQPSEDDFSPVSSSARPRGRRSLRLKDVKHLNVSRDRLNEIEEQDSEDSIQRRGPTTRAKKQSLHRATQMSDIERTQRVQFSEERQHLPEARRSERTRTKSMYSMRERNEDELSSQSEKEQGIKITTVKEIFMPLARDDPFRKRHQQECATCYMQGDLDAKGPLVFCQGCTNSYHRGCLGHRSSRDHLVTKVGDKFFVLQCKRCVGVHRQKDSTAPHLGRCVTCDHTGPLSKLLRRRLTPKQEQQQREENGGSDPITITTPSMLNNIDNVMFRCATCNRAWHMHHLPARKTVASGDFDNDDDEEEDLDEKQLTRKRFDHYHRSWICKDCVENQAQADTIVAWRPVNQEGYVPGTKIDRLQENQKEYLVKWKNQSYLRCTWMPGTWIWGTVPPSTRAAFERKVENHLPRMTTKDAVPEEYQRVDIVFDVRYTSVVRNSSQGIDFARAKEVDSAYVKYKGLGHEDAIWEKPPHYTELERWADFKEAYEDYVRKKYMSIPAQSTLRRKLAEVRNTDFETGLIKKTQSPIMTGGQIMQYQLEGHNWLYYQWYRQHNAILADEMGLGKTIQLISLFATLIHEHKCWPFLIVVPNSTCPNWRREIKKWVPTIRAVCYYGSRAARKLTHEYELFPKDSENDTEEARKRSKEQREIKAHIVIASYESIIEKSVSSSLMRVPWQGLVVDEGQRLKSDKNMVYEVLSKYRFPFKVLMTGTPLQNNARELFNLLQFLDRDKHNAAALEAKYAELTQESIPELHELLKPYFLRRTKVQVLTFLPPMSQIIVPVSMSVLQKKVYKSILAQNPELMKSIFARDVVAGKERANLNNILMQLRKSLCHPFVYSRSLEDRSVDADTSFQTLVEASSKLQLLSIMLPKLKERGHRVLLFSQFLDNLDIIEDFLDGLGMLHRRLDGTINALEKQKRIDEFNMPGSPYFAFLLSTRAGGVGINLATADTVIILDPDFNPHQDIQALSRAHRIGQQHKVMVFQLITRASAEEKIMQVGKKKMALDHALIESMDQADEAGMDLESILRHGAEALFSDDISEDITYNEASIDKLLDRSQIESTKTSESQSAESQFSFARIWANDKATLEDRIETSGTNTPNPGIWDKILEVREKAFEEEAIRKAEQLGRGKRRRERVNYNAKADHEYEGHDNSSLKDDNGRGSDEEFEEVTHDTTDVDATGAEDTEPELVTVRARPFKRIKVPVGQAPYFNGDGPAGPMTHAPMPAIHRCLACREDHPIGWCRLKIAGVEHCGLCGAAHLGWSRNCPHLNDEKQVEILLQTLKESTEDRQLVDEARKYLAVIRGDLVSRRRKTEREAQQRAEQRSNMQPAFSNV